MQPPLTFKFGAWTPDIPALVNPAFPATMEAYFTGGEVPLTVAQNVYWRSSGYRPMLSLAAISSALPAKCLGAIAVFDSNEAVQIFAGTATDLYKLSGTSWSNVSKSSGAYTATNWSFQAYGNCLNATDGTDAIQSIDITTGAAFADLDDTDPAPKCQVLGVIRDFVFAGNTTDATNGTVPNRVQWSAIALDGSWPIPGTQDAFAYQAGAQTLDSDYGPVMAIGDNEQFGLIFQQNGISRASYTGGNTVFDFVTYEKKRGSVGPGAVERVGDKYYFLSGDGFCLTDGSQVQNIGYGKVNDWFNANANTSALSSVRTCVDTQNKIVIWAFPLIGQTSLGGLIIYNYAEDRFSYVIQAVETLFTVPVNGAMVAAGVSAAHAYGQFTGSAGAALLQTESFSITPGGRTFVNGVRPLLDGTASVSVGTRNDLSAAVAYGSYVAQAARSGISPQRADAFYHAIAINPNSGFADCIGFSVFNSPSGAT